VAELVVLLTIIDKVGLAIASETSLIKDWLKQEEDRAWKDL
jgi:hypothetical protein